MSAHKLPVFLTVDTEIWPYKPGWPAVRLTEKERDLSQQFERCILGASDRGELGLRYQMAALNRHGLSATFFVEPLHSVAVGERWLTETVGMILAAGHDVQMHAHTEWLADTIASEPGLPSESRVFLRQYAIADQVRILGWAKRRLQECGAPASVAFRAGNFGANADTLRALDRIGVAVDASANRCYAGGHCMIDVPDQPTAFGSVVEFPMAVFEDYPGHVRHVQLAACSAYEMERALRQAWTHRWRAFVVLWHGSELLLPGFDRGRRSRPSAVVVRRFERMCRFLGEHRDKFETMLFSRVNPASFTSGEPPRPLSSSMFLTAHRMAEQTLGRFL